MTTRKRYVHYGCALVAPSCWENYDASPTLRIQKIPIIGRLLKNKLNIIFPENARVGDIIKGLPVESNSCDGVFCSHVLEHLSLEDLRVAIKNTYDILKDDGIFRCVVPDLESFVRIYISSVESRDKEAALCFMKNTFLGMEKRPKGLVGLLKFFYGNSRHLWMWDLLSLKNELEQAGFKKIRIANFNDSEDKMFKYVESEERFIDAIAFECTK